MMAMVLDIFITVYNEGRTLEAVITAINREMSGNRYPYRITVLDDGSTDWPASREARIKGMDHLRVFRYERNRGKGAVLNDVFPQMDGRIAVVIDADNEYLASDIHALVAPVMNDEADWVLGSRYGYGRKRPRQYLMTYAANVFFNQLFNLFSGLNLHDLMSGLFAFKSEMVEGIHLRQRRFAFTPELMWKVLRSKGPRIREVPISYHFRTYAEGKGVKWWEFFTVTWAIIRYGVKRMQ